MTYLTHLEADQLQSIAADLAARLSQMPYRHPEAENALQDYVAWLESIPCGAHQRLVEETKNLRPAEAVEPLTCDTCGTVTENPWHYSKGDKRHNHACDECWPKVSLDEQEGE